MASFEVCDEWDGPPDEVLRRIALSVKCRGLFGIWNETRCGVPRLPAKADVDPILLAKAGLMPYLWVVERDDAGDCFYRLAGEGVRKYFAAPIKGRYLRDVFAGDVYDLISARYDRILDEQRVEFSEGDVLRGDRAIYFARRLLVPLTDETGRPRYLIGTVDQSHYDAMADGPEPPHYTYSFIGTLALADL